MKTVQTTLTRPANVTAYAAADQMADSTSAPTPLTFTDAAFNAGRAVRVTAAAFVNTNQAVTNCDLDLILFATEPTPSNDNAAYDMGTDQAAYRGTVSVANGDWGVASSDKFVNKVLAKPGVTLIPASGSRDIYGLLVARGAYTPTSEEVTTITLTVEPV